MSGDVRTTPVLYERTYQHSSASLLIATAVYITREETRAVHPHVSRQRERIMRFSARKVYNYKLTNNCFLWCTRLRVFFNMNLYFFRHSNFFKMVFPTSNN